MVQDTSPFVCDIILALNMPVTWPRSKILNLMLDPGVIMRDCGFLLGWQMWF